MNKIEAAYEFGYSVPMMYRATLYHWRFAPWMKQCNYYDGTADHLRMTMDRFAVSLDHLKPNIGRNKVSRIDEKFQAAKEIAMKLVEAFEVDGEWGSGDYGHGPCPALAQYEALANQTSGVLKDSPRLHAWRNVGLAVGACSFSTIVQDPSDITIDLRPLCQAVNSLNPAVWESLPFLTRCAGMQIDEPLDDPVRVLAAVLDPRSQDAPERLGKQRPDSKWFAAVDEDHKSTPRPRTHVFSQLMLLDVEFKKSIKRLSELQVVRLQLDDSDPKHCQAIMDGRAFEVSHLQLLILKSLLDAAGDYITNKDIEAEHAITLGNTKLHRQIKSLHESIRKRITPRPGQGGGYRMLPD